MISESNLALVNGEGPGELEGQLITDTTSNSRNLRTKVLWQGISLRESKRMVGADQVR